MSIIKAGESETVWILPHADCAVTTRYEQGTTQKSELLIGYLSNGMGGKATHKLGTNDISGT